MRSPIPFARVLTSGVIRASRATIPSISGSKQHNFGATRITGEDFMQFRRTAKKTPVTLLATAIAVALQVTAPASAQE